MTTEESNCEAHKMMADISKSFRISAQKHNLFLQMIGLPPIDLNTTWKEMFEIYQKDLNEESKDAK